MEKRRFRRARRADQDEIDTTEYDDFGQLRNKIAPLHQSESLKEEVEDFFRQIHTDYINSFKRLMKKRRPIQSNIMIWADEKLEKYSSTMQRTDLDNYILKIRFLAVRAAPSKVYTEILESQINQFIEDLRMHIFINNHDPLNLLSNLFLGYRTVKLAASNAKEILNRSDYYKRLLESKFHQMVVRTSTVDGCIDTVNSHQCNEKVIIMSCLEFMEMDLEQHTYPNTDSQQQHDNRLGRGLRMVNESGNDMDTALDNIFEPKRAKQENTSNSVQRMSLDELVDFIEGDRPTKTSARKRRRNKKKLDEDSNPSTCDPSSSPPENGPLETAEISNKVFNEIDNEVEEFRRRLEFTPTKEEKLKANITKEWVSTLRTKLKETSPHK